jgi:hypothetical protein
MAFTPVIPTSGLAGWNFLQATLPQQEEVFGKSPEIAREIDYFKETIGDIKTLDDFMGDRRVLKVALEAFGLGEEINKGAFVRKVLEDGVDDRSDFAVRLANSDYIALAENFNFTNGDLSLSQTSIDEIADRFERQSFEVEVGTVNNSMRLALNFERKIGDYVGQGSSEAGGWFGIMGSLPMREVVEKAFNLPSSFSSLDIDKQQEIFSDKMNAKYGDKSIESFGDPEILDDLISNYLLREELENGTSAVTSSSTALSILGGGSSGLGSAGLFNILLSNA